ncbi:acetyl-CoA carboxylase biotin carboxylase subunit [Hansschlegelia zhihuaiae]|uniref:biotin carboxylase n=1 Tax=Hansschlegelia zhihuaiae TaxID=405005 RepID=A0A4Q0MIG6_9HYPH|nr:acetyl-CoA carboxylase biotin carboxylase subunit [Hansschlegelia zhihuaiae]
MPIRKNFQYEFSDHNERVNWLEKRPEGVKRVLIANRGEIALRAARTCRKLGLESVAVYSSADVNAPHVWAADRAVCIGPPPPKASYLKSDALLEVARATGCDAVYPGYGFLSEKADFAVACADAGVVFVGPSAEAIATMGDKVAARRAAAALGVPVVPGSETGFVRAEDAEPLALEIGFPLLLKASGGGGGRGMRVAAHAGEFRAQFEQATAEADAAFGQADVYLERFFPRVRHIEIQIFGDRHGAAVHLWERDCSVQRRHQKLVEEAPSPALRPETRRRMADAALSLVRALRYEGAGTVEFIYDVETAEFFFIEMNTRIQVEHPVTEMLTGTDLVAEQFRVAAGEPLSFGAFPEPDGRYAIEFRINAEDAARNFQPAPGTLTRWRPPTGAGVRLDSHVYETYRIPPFYDSMLGKLIVTAESRARAIETARGALARFEVAGAPTTIPFHAALIGTRAFAEATVHTRWVETEFQTMEAAA